MMTATEARWYAVYTFARHEKTVAQQLSIKGVHHYLPLYERVSRWNDRSVRIQAPLFPGYVFVHIPAAARVKVLQTAGVVRFVAFNGRPSALPQHEIENLQKYLVARRAEPYPYLVKGQRVLIRSGALAGLEGIVVRRKGKLRIVIAVDSIRQAVALELEASDVQLAI